MKRTAESLIVCRILSLGRGLTDGMFQFSKFTFLVILNVLVLSQDPVYDDWQYTDLEKSLN